MMGHYEDSGNQARASREETESDFSNSRIASQVAYMVVENNKVLCVECGFEVTAISTLTPEATFDGHKCRLVSQSESTSF